MTDSAKFSTTLQQIVDAGFVRDQGQIKAIFIRLPKEQRRELQEASLTLTEGVIGDRWQTKDPRTQITMMNSSLLDQLSEGDRSRWALAGDQLIVDLDLSEKNLPIGQHLRIGAVTLAITDVPHTGCVKFRDRYGIEASDFISAPERASLRLRGVYAKVVIAGTIKVGDLISKL